MGNTVKIEDIKHYKLYKLVLHPGKDYSVTIEVNDIQFTRNNIPEFSYITFRSVSQDFSGLKLHLGSYTRHWELQELEY
jgi:hypothetical protein